MIKYTIINDEIFPISDIDKWKDVNFGWILLQPKFRYNIEIDKTIIINKEEIIKFYSNIFLILNKEVKISWGFQKFDKQFNNSVSYYLYFTFDNYAEECIYLLQKSYYTLRDDNILFG